MKFLVYGAGAVGGFFGGRMAAAGLDVGFIVRDRRARELHANGLKISSPNGNTHLMHPKIYLAGNALPEADVLLLAIKATGLSDAIYSLKETIRDSTLIIPLLNGLRHIDILVDAFGDKRVAGGLCYIQASMDNERVIHCHSKIQKLIAGPLNDNQVAVLQGFIDHTVQAGIDAEYSSDVYQAMWDKISFLATLAGVTCIARGSVGEIVATPFGKEITRGLFEECIKIAKSAGYPLSAAAITNSKKMLLARDSGLISSMLGDIRADNPTEGDHILGDLIARAEQNSILVQYLKAAHTAILVHDGQRVRPFNNPPSSV